MSYTESDVVEHIFDGISRDDGIGNVIRELINWYEHQNSLYKINKWDTKEIEKRIKILKSKL